ncbi:phage virion morphogenesis protein [Novosphingobium rosa]|uniref:phage virion morphogenesis protein n=1 Tax=Novosphingobium rosa TaxID=76978 RepID=UPI000B06A766|nr:phage virion morphogenesis protein [Novosphingobium rosa]
MEELEGWLEKHASYLSEQRRAQLARKIGQQLRASNAARVAANLEPDGSPMAPRKPRPDGKPRRLKPRAKRMQGKGRMFRRIELARNMRIQTAADHVELRFNPSVQETAEVHHFGKEAPVDPRIANSIKVRYPARRLLGHGAGDDQDIMAAALAFLEGKGLA